MLLHLILSIPCGTNLQVMINVFSYKSINLFETSTKWCKSQVHETHHFTLQTSGPHHAFVQVLNLGNEGYVGSQEVRSTD